MGREQVEQDCGLAYHPRGLSKSGPMTARLDMRTFFINEEKEV